jgi:hypothetical protein
MIKKKKMTVYREIRHRPEYDERTRHFFVALTHTAIKSLDFADELFCRYA